MLSQKLHSSNRSGLLHIGRDDWRNCAGRGAIVSDTNNTLEILVNLMYLARHSVDDPQKVIEYLTQAEGYALRLAETVHKRDRLPAD